MRGEWIGAKGSLAKALAWPKKHKGRIGQRTSRDIKAGVTIQVAIYLYSLRSGPDRLCYHRDNFVIISGQECTK